MVRVFAGKRFIFEKAKELGVRTVIIDGPESWSQVGSAAQRSTAQRSAAQRSGAQCSGAQRSAAQRSAAQHRALEGQHWKEDAYGRYYWGLLRRASPLKTAAGRQPGY
jgi:hypothetical protein